MCKGCKQELEERQRRRSPDGGLSCTQGRRDITTEALSGSSSHRSDVINSISLFRETFLWNGGAKRQPEVREEGKAGKSRAGGG